MKNVFHHFGVVLLLVAFSAQNVSAKDKTDNAESAKTDSARFQTLNYDTTGSVTIGLGMAKFEIPKGFKYLNGKQSEYVLHDLWGNPPSQTLGMIFPDEADSIFPSTWAIEITYDEDGHVKDDDAKDIKYDELLEQMQKEVKEINPERKKQGYPTFQLTGWASPPYYDEKEKKLHWAKRILFEGDSTETLNYNIRVLGRKGVLILNAIGTMDQLEEIKSQINPILANVNFSDGNKYADFDSNVDKVAAYGIGGLIAGGVLLKTGLFAKIGLVLLKFGKLILIGGAAVVAGIVKFFKGKKDNEVNPNA